MIYDEKADILFKVSIFFLVVVQVIIYRLLSPYEVIKFPRFRLPASCPNNTRTHIKMKHFVIKLWWKLYGSALQH